MAKKKAVPSTKKTTSKKTVEATTEIKSFVLVGCDKFYKQIKQMPIIGALLAEFIGTFILVASIFMVQNSPLFVAFTIVGVVLMIGGVSGAYINPAMTVGAWITRKINWMYAVGYIAAQCLGAIIAWLVFSTFIKGAPETYGTTATLFHAATIPADKEWYVFFAELLGATALGIGFAQALKHSKNKIVSAFTYGMGTLIALLISMQAINVFLTEQSTGLSFMNPAVAIATNAFNGLTWDNFVWPIAIFLFAPLVGGVFGFVIQDILAMNDECDCDSCKLSK